MIVMIKVMKKIAHAIQNTVSDAIMDNASTQNIFVTGYLIVEMEVMKLNVITQNAKNLNVKTKNAYQVRKKKF